jgi:hypothetical protein
VQQAVAAAVSLLPPVPLSRGLRLLHVSKEAEKHLPLAVTLLATIRYGLCCLGVVPRTAVHPLTLTAPGDPAGSSASPQPVPTGLHRHMVHRIWGTVI